MSYRSSPSFAVGGRRFDRSEIVRAFDVPASEARILDCRTFKSCQIPLDMALATARMIDLRARKPLR